MKTCLRLIWASMFLIAFTQVTNSQMVPDAGFSGSQYGGVYEPGTFQPMVGDVNVGMPGRFWVGGSYADRGLGYRGSYLTVGMKNRLFTDRFDGRWLFEGRGHYSLESGGFFGNFGLERVITIDSARADVSVGAWADYDGDEQGLFAHSFAQVGVSGAIKTRRWDLVGNGYFPVGTTDYQQIGPPGFETFFQNVIVLEPGSDSALRGFDATLNMRPAFLGMVNGTVGVGGYGYGSELVEYFGGGRVRASMELLQGMILTAEVNHDDRFDTTGVLNFTWMFGVNARGNEYAGLGRDLERTIRNDHIVRTSGELLVAINPDTGLPYNVIHVNNTADAAFGDGTIETPFTSLADAEAASMANDVIFVQTGDGTARFMDEGITLKDGQYFLGQGVDHIIPIQDGLNYVIETDGVGGVPTISGSFRGNAVTLADNNTVRGFNIDGTAGRGGGMANGIFGDGFTLADDPLVNGIIEDVSINNAILSGVSINGIAGDWTFNRVTSTTNGVDGIFIQNACDPTSVLTFTNNVLDGNGEDGLHLLNYDAETLTISQNQANDNGRDGIRLENFKNQSGNGLTLDLLANETTGNDQFGVHIAGGDGNLRILNGNITDNAGGGLRISNWTTTNPRDMVFIGPGLGGTSNFSNNLGGPGIDILLESGIMRALITGTTADNNLIGLQTTSRGVGTNMFVDVLDNFSFSNNLIDGIRAVATGGSTQFINIDQPNSIGAFSQLPITGNGLSGINLLAGVDSLGSTSVLQATMDNLLITGNGQGVNLASNQDGQIRVFMEDSIVNLNGVGITGRFNNNNNNALNVLNLQRITLDNNATDAITLVSQGGTLADISIRNSLITASNSDYNPPGGPPQGGPGFTNNQAVFGQGIGINVVALGDNNNTRVTIIDNDISNQSFNGINLVTRGSANMLADITGNVLDFNGFGPGDTPNTGTVNAVLPFFHGIDISSNDTSTLAYRMVSNDINNSFEFGARQLANDSSNMIAIWLNNDLSGNDIADDLSTIPGENLGIDFVVANVGPLANTCWSLSTNLFDTNVIANTGLAANFIVELDGITNNNGFNNGDIGTPFTSRPFGSTCQPAYDAVVAAFDAAGFPPSSN